VKIANRMGRGYSFDAIRAKMLFGPLKERKQVRAPFGKDPALFSGCYDSRDLGVSLPHLIELLSVNH
jgi:hypothetical protein